jgi:hypothetical protein
MRRLGQEVDQEKIKGPIATEKPLGSVPSIGVARAVVWCGTEAARATTKVVFLLHRFRD